MTPAENFSAKVVPFMDKLMARFGLSVDDAAAVFGNLGYESLGFTTLQEIKPVVAGSAGGYGWAQWTGPRRRAFEAFCKSRAMNPASDAANYAFLEYELAGTESAAIPAVKAAVGLDAKVKAFERSFERAGVKAYAGRIKWANIAKDAWTKAQAAAPKPVPVPPPAAPAEPAKSNGLQKTMAVIAGLIAAAVAALFAFNR
jgi:hypothetical protein